MAVIFKHRKGESVYCGEGCTAQVTTAEVMGGHEIEVCDFCGQPDAAGFWHGFARSISVCKDCALNALPKLLADALVGEYGDNREVVQLQARHLETVQKNFWKAVAHAIHRAARDAHRLPHARNGKAG